MVVNNPIRYFQGGLYIKNLPRNDLKSKNTFQTITKISVPTLYLEFFIVLEVWTSISDLPTSKLFVQTFFQKKSMAEKYPTYLWAVP